MIIPRSVAQQPPPRETGQEWKPEAHVALVDVLVDVGDTVTTGVITTVAVEVSTPRPASLSAKGRI